MKNNIKTYRKLAASLAAVIVLILLTAAGLFAGNPLIKLYLENKTKNYIKNTYPMHSLEITDSRYSGQDMFRFHFTVKDRNISDVEFDISWYDNGSTVYDSYPYQVSNMYNTFQRLSDELSSDVSGILSEYSEFDGFTVGAVYGDWGQEKFTGGEGNSNFYLDMPYIRENINVPVSVYLKLLERPQDSSFENAVELARSAYSILQDKGISAEYISVILSVNCGDCYCERGGKIHRSQLYQPEIADILYSEHLSACKQCTRQQNSTNQ